jgi:hypothetical protein
MPRRAPVIRSDTPKPPASVYRLRVALEGSTPRIWRRLEVFAETRLSELSAVLLAAMGWEDSHLHQFAVRGTYYGRPHSDYGGETLDEARYTLAQVAPNSKDIFRFEYDFGDSWNHSVTVQAIIPAENGARYPRCTGGANACPPEDCGGIWGYAHLLEVLADPKHKEYKELLQWVGGSFDPEHFDPEEVNAALRPFAGSPKRSRART